MIRIDLYSAAGEKLPYPSLDAVEACSYTLGLERIGSFSFQIAASHISAQNVATGQQAWIYESTEGLVFKGKISGRTYQADATGRRVLSVTGDSIAIELQHRTVGLGLIFEDEAFATAIDAVLDDTDWTAGALDSSANIPARRLDARQKWDSLRAIADVYQYSVREDNLNQRVDIGAFGDASGVRLTNRRTDILTLTEPTVAPLSNVRVISRAGDIWNRLYPVGQIQGLGGAVLTLSGVSPDAPVATRLYLPSNNGVDNLAPVSPSFNSDWASTAGAARLTAGLTPAAAAMATEARAATGAHLLHQYVYGPIAAQTITGNISGQMRVQEASAALNHYFRINVRVFDSTGTTLRGTPLAATSVGTEFSDVALTNHAIPSTALTSVDALDGDYLVIEIGRTGGLGQADMRFGDAATSDLPEDQTTTDDYRPWIEFDNWIAPYFAITPEDTAYPVQTVTKNGQAHYYIEDAASVAAYGLRDRVFNAKDIMPLGLTAEALSQASGTLHGLASAFLRRHKDEQIAYEAEAVGLRHINPNGLPYLKVGQTLHIDYQGIVVDQDGTIRADETIDADPYLMGFTRTFGQAGESKWSLTVSSVMRPLPDDGEVITEMLRDIGIAKIAPITEFRIPDGGRIVTAGGSYWDDLKLVLAAAGVVGDCIVIQVSDGDRFYITADDTAVMMQTANYDGRESTVYLTGGHAELGFRTLGANTLGVTNLEVWEKGVAVSAQHGVVDGDFGSGEGVLFIDEAVTVPTTNPANGIVLYVESGTLKARTTAGNVRTIASV